MIQRKNQNEINIENLDEQREYIQKNVNRILAHSPKRNSKLENRLIDYFLMNYDEITNYLNFKIDAEQINVLIKRSQNDIKRADDAYKDKDFNNTVYLLQQSTEKIVKSYGLFLGVITNPKKEVGHKPSKVYLKMLKMSWIEKIPELFNFNSKKSIEYLKFLENNIEEKQKLDDSIPLLLNLFNNIYGNANKEFSKREMKQVLLAMKKFNGINLKKLCNTQIYLSYFICPFAIISSAYENEPRYSDDITDLKIISHYPKISKHLKNSISYIEKDIQNSVSKSELSEENRSIE